MTLTLLTLQFKRQKTNKQTKKKKEEKQQTLNKQKCAWGGGCKNNENIPPSIILYFLPYICIVYSKRDNWRKTDNFRAKSIYVIHVFCVNALLPSFRIDENYGVYSYK